MNSTLAVILAGGASGELPVLTAHRSKAALPYGGRYRVIDFCLSNCTNSGIYNVAILAQYNPASLIAHIGNGRPWDLNRRRGGLAILQPYAARTESNWFRGTADALLQHIDIIRDNPCRNVLVLSADQVYKMDYAALVRFHRDTSSTATIAAKHSSECTTRSFGGLEVDEDNIVGTFVEKPEDQMMRFFSLGVYVFEKESLLEQLSSAGEGHYDIVFDVLMPMIGKSRVSAYVFDDYWADVGWLQQYYESSMVLLRRDPPLVLGDPAWPIFSKPEIRSPSLIGTGSQVESSLIANGCFIEGEVRGSILFPGVKVRQGASVEDSIVFSDTVIEKGAAVKACIIDKRVRVGREAVLGYGNPTCPNTRYPEVVSSGITVVGTQTRVPDGIRVGRNCLIGSDLSPEIIPSRDIVCGETLSSEVKWQRTS
jgi:glucose-1-phosphate adenylyltransferase